MTGPTAQQLKTLAEATTYREFLERWLQIRKEGGKPLPYAAISRRAGFSARSFPREVAKGMKRLTLQSLHPFIHGLGLKGDLATLFKLLVEWEHEDCRTQRQTEKQILRRMEMARSRLLRPQKNRGVKIFDQDTAPRVYAALGNAETGATFTEIQQRTRLPKSILEGVLNKLVALKLVEPLSTPNSQRWRATESHLNLTELTVPEGYPGFFLSAQSRAARTLPDGMSDLQKLYLTTCFSVNTRELPALKARLRALLLEFTEQSEASEGDQVVTLNCSLL